MDMTSAFIPDGGGSERRGFRPAPHGGQADCLVSAIGPVQRPFIRREAFSRSKAGESLPNGATQMNKLVSVALAGALAAAAIAATAGSASAGGWKPGWQPGWNPGWQQHH